MKLTLSSKPFVLQPDTLVGLRGAKNARVRVLRGRLWLTVAGMHQDVILEPGSAFLFSNNALALLEAKTECELSLEPRRKRLLFSWRWLKQRKNGRKWLRPVFQQGG